MSSDGTCKEATTGNAACSLADRLSDTTFALSIFRWENALYFFFIIFFVLVSKYVYWLQLAINWKYCPKMDIDDATKLLSTKKSKKASHADDDDEDEWVPHLPEVSGPLGINLETILLHDDNKAVAAVFAGYMGAIGLIVQSAMSSLTNVAGDDVGAIFFWAFYGTVLLLIAGVLNQVGVISRLVPFSTLVTHQNLAVAAVAMGSYLSAGQIVAASISGAPTNYGDDVLSCSIYFVLSQGIFLLFSLLFRQLTTYDLKDEMMHGNVAAGVSYALHMIAISTMMQASLRRSESLMTFTVWFVVSGVAVTLFKFVCDLIILPGNYLEDEIALDRNWGAALIVGGLQICMAMGLNGFLPDLCPSVYFALGDDN